jgi:UDP-N-acetylglucosamine--N-acetylmuramyl-(pentapeptide) pyrophosphoryl-undecaprenol N-acetylglucosamine transferase
MADRHFFFAGGGTGGHIYPAVAVAEHIARLDASARIHFLCGGGPLEAGIIERAGLAYTALPARPFSPRPAGLAAFAASFLGCYRASAGLIAAAGSAVVVGTGGFVAAPVCLAARRLAVPVVLLSVDAVPGRASRLISRWAAEIFVQFEQSRACFAKRAPVRTAGCPIRTGFAHPDPAAALRSLNLAGKRKTLLVMGGSSGSESINEAFHRLREKLDGFAGPWQVVHLSGKRAFERVSKTSAAAKIEYRVLEYYHDMPDLLAAADLVVGRSGAVSVAEYAASGTACICLPYPHHADRHQYLNAVQLAEAGAAVIVDDVSDAGARAAALWRRLEPLMRDEAKRALMSAAARRAARLDAAEVIAQQVIARGK